MNKLEKKYPTIGCCGIDCGLCPRYYTEGKSRCPGCFGPQFMDIMGQSCSFITCCVKNKNHKAKYPDNFPNNIITDWIFREFYQKRYKKYSKVD